MKNRFQQSFMFLFLFGLIFISTSLKSEKLSQKTERHVIVFKINHISTYEESSAIDAYMTNKEGILATRSNHINSTYFCYALKSKDLKKSDFETWFSELGYTISCFDKVIYGKGSVMSHKELENCKP